MIITTNMAQPIVDQMIKVIDYNVNIMNHEGVIVASGDEGRIHQIHQGALEAIELKRERIIHRTDFKNMVGTSVGVNVPIEMKDKIVGVVGITGDPTKIYKFIHIIKITVETLLEQQLLIEQLRYKHTALEEWVQNLVDVNYNDIPLLESKAKYLNININIECSVFAFEILDFNQRTYDYETLHKNEVRIMQLFKLYYPQCLFPTYIGKGIFIAGLSNKTYREVHQLTELGQDIHDRLLFEGITSYIGIGNPNQGILGYRTSYLEALQSIDILKQISSEKHVAHISEWGVLQLLTQVPPKIRQSFLTQFTNNKQSLHPELDETLTIFLKNDLSIKETSFEMHIHRNTLIYRLEKIKELLDLDPRKFKDAVKLQLLNWCKMLK
ncbi:CdaR family transcriptional regulator [Pseudogracilibacillus auburnensis]|uniref:CdaR family transcriptional regulator n=1 Tax=Pseudogracilibacillus auburnensis TaxID=1494959 RepID=UPI001A977580|nr:sugar diacid recognition domain-containing protein [Pseudogracilibacillus auburnensis]MBO1001906.1 helix-turn-helix domain-containing protein [Pseudogracilibacillus auburnensis]